MQPPTTSRPSVTGRALLAIGLMIGFYTLALGIAGGLLYLAYADVTHSRHPHVKVIFGCVITAGIVLWAVIPRGDRFEPPGPRLDPNRQRRLFPEINSIATSVHQEMPAEIYLVPDINAWVSQRGGFMGFGSRRVMGLGLPLLQVLTLTEFRAVLTHEFGHYHGGDTKLGPWVYKTHGAIGRTVTALDEQGSILNIVFVGYAKLFLRISHAVSRRQELAADELAARLVGSQGLGNGLRKVHGASAAFQPYLNGEFLPVLNAGFRPPLADGFARFLDVQRIADAVKDLVNEELQQAQKNPYDTHPPLKERLEAIRHLSPGSVPANDLPAISLLEDVPELETQLLMEVTGEPKIRTLKPLAWEHIGRQVWVPVWENGCKEIGTVLSGATPASLAGLLPRLSEIGRLVLGKQMSDDELQRTGMQILGAALCLALVKEGWSLEALPGSPVIVRRGDASLEPFNVLVQLTEGKLTAETWRQQCASLGIANLDLGRSATP